MQELVNTFNIHNYHWAWYLIGYAVCPRLTIMIWISIYFGNVLPLALMIIGWLWAITPTIRVTHGN